MSIDAVMARLRAVADRFEPRYGYEEPPRFAGPSGRFAVSAIQDAVGRELPDPMWDFFTACDEIVAMDIRNGYRLGGTGWVRRMVTAGAFPRHVEAEGEPVRVVPFASDGGGNGFLVGLGDEGVWGWDHETGRTRRVADSFAAFLARVADDWEAFAADAPGWTYLV